MIASSILLSSLKLRSIDCKLVSECSIKRPIVTSNPPRSTKMLFESRMAVVRYIPSLFRLIFFDSLGCESFKSSIVAKKRKEKSRGSEVSGRETRLTMPELDPWDILNLNKRKISDSLRIYHVISYR